MRQGHDVIEWGTEGNPSFEVLKNTGRNEYVEFDRRITLTGNLADAVGKSEIIIISISSQNLRSFMQRVVACENVQDKTFVLCMKGIEADTGTLPQVLIVDHVDGYALDIRAEFVKYTRYNWIDGVALI